MFDPDSDSAFAASQQKEGRNYVKFYRQWVRNNFKSQQQGCEVGEEQDFIIIVSPGQAKTEVRRKATDNDKATYSHEWAAYLQGKEQQQSGTPIELLPGLPAGMADSLKALYIYTIEQMAGLSDAGLQRVGMGGAELRLKARAYLSKGSAELEATRAELEAARLSITTLTTANAAMLARLEALEAAVSTKPKRMPKSTQQAEAVMLS